MPRAASLTLVVGLSLISSLGLASPAAAACVAADMRVADDEAAPGGVITIAGRGWRDRCNDVTTQPVGGTPSPQTPAQPDEVTISFTQNGETTQLTTLVADADFSFKTQVRVPTSAAAGPATITASDGGTERATDELMVTASAATPAAELPRTGHANDVAALGVAGGTLLMLGVALLWVGRAGGSSPAA